MNRRFENLQFACDLWTIRGRNGTLTYTENTIFFDSDGLLFTCELNENNGVTVRKDVVKNTTAQPITFSAPRMNFKYNGGEYEVYTQYNGWQTESIGAWQPLNTTIEAGCRSARTAQGAAPMLALWNKQAARGTVFHLLPESTWRIEATRLPCGGSLHTVQITAGFYDTPTVTLAPNESLTLPVAVFYDFRNHLDLDAWKLHRWFNACYPRRTLPVIYDTWLYRFDHFTPEQIAAQVEAAAALGVEYFVIDAGWFGKLGNWFSSVGDWFESDDSAMRGQMLQIAEKVRACGMKFGLWFEIERASDASEIAKQHPEYFIRHENTYFLDFSKKIARDYILDTIDRLAKKYGIEFIKFDFNADLPDDYTNCAFTDYFAGHRMFIRQLREMHPEIYLQNCASGGARMHLCDSIVFDSFWPTDDQSPYVTMRIIKDSLRRLPPQVIERWATITSLPAFKPAYTPPYHSDKILATNDATWDNITGINTSWLTGMLYGSPIGFSCDLTAFTPELTETLKTQIAEFKADRAFWMQAECRILADTDSILILQYSDPQLARIELLVFSDLRMQVGTDVYPAVDTAAVYMVNNNRINGTQLDEDGLNIDLNGSYGMQHVTLKKI